MLTDGLQNVNGGPAAATAAAEAVKAEGGRLLMLGFGDVIECTGGGGVCTCDGDDSSDPPACDQQSHPDAYTAGDVYKSNMDEYATAPASTYALYFNNVQAMLVEVLELVNVACTEVIYVCYLSESCAAPCP